MKALVFWMPLLLVLSRAEMCLTEVSTSHKSPLRSVERWTCSKSNPYKKEIQSRSVEREDALQDAILTLNNGDIIEIQAAEIALFKSLIISATNVTLKGKNDANTTIVCPRRGKQYALVIKSTGIVVESLKFTKCRSASAIVVYGKAHIGEKTLVASISNVAFESNGHASAAKLMGAGLHIACFKGGAVFVSVSVFSNHHTEALSGQNSLEIVDCNFSDNSEITCDFTVYSRACSIGEYISNHICIPCHADHYAFNHTAEKCEMCDRKEANCVGGAVLAPLDGYWHSTPYSPQFHQCLYEDACKFKNRTKCLIDYYDNQTRMEEDLDQLAHFINGSGDKPNFPDYIQCATGYCGLLCASCSKGYGKSLNGACVECPKDKTVACVLCMLSLLWILILVSVTSGITLASVRARIQLVKLELHRRTSTIQHLSRLERSPGINVFTTRNGVARTQTSTIQSSNQGQQGTSLLSLNRYLISIVQLAETLKIFINYLQVTSSALGLQGDWMLSLKVLLSSEAVFVGVVNESLSIPFECMFMSQKWIQPATIATWFRILSPFMVFVNLVFIFSLFWIPYRHFIQKHRSLSRSMVCTREHHSWFTCVVVMLIVTIHFSFISMTKDLLRTINCKALDKRQNSANPYEKYAVEMGCTVWVEDTALDCFKGEHKLSAFIGIMGLFVALMIIVFIIIWLPLNEQYLEDTEFLTRHWFIYQGYRRQWYTSCWEAAILIRKALIAVVIVFAVHLGHNLQASLCVGILIFALIMQISLHPFKIEHGYEAVPEYFSSGFQLSFIRRYMSRLVPFSNTISLNGVESLSLLCSALFFYSAIIFNDSYTSIVGKYFVAGFTFSVTLSFLVYMFFRLYAGLHGTLDSYLEIVDPGFGVRSNNGPGINSLFVKVYRAMALHWNHLFLVPGSLEDQSSSLPELGSLELSTWSGMIDSSQRVCESTE